MREYAKRSKDLTARGSEPSSSSATYSMRATTLWRRSHIASAEGASGIDVVARYSAVFTVRDGKIVRFRDFASRGAALEAVGLAE
jgi:hypothetical protein